MQFEIINSIPILVELSFNWYQINKQDGKIESSLQVGYSETALKLL